MSNFSKAFATARKAGKATFMFGGKSYHTRVKGETKDTKTVKVSPAPKTVPVPQSRPSGKTPVPQTKPSAKVPIPQSNPKNAPASGIARKGSPMAVAAQRQREKPVAAPRKDTPQTPGMGMPSGKPRGTVVAKAPTPDQKSAAQKKAPIPKSNPKNAPANGIARKGSPLAIAFKRLSERVTGKSKSKSKKTGGDGW